MIDLRQDLNRILVEIRWFPFSSAEVFGKIEQILGTTFELYSVFLGQNSQIPLTPARNDCPVESIRQFQLATDPIDVHQCGDGNVEDFDFTFERHRGAQVFDNAFEGRSRQTPCDEQDPFLWFDLLSRAVQRTTPPLTLITCPVMKEASSDSRNRAVRAMSSGVPQRLSGVSRITRSCQ